MWELVTDTLYLFLPAYAANMTPVFARRFNILPFLARPLDGGAVVGGQPILGSHKTVRGLIFGLLAGIVVAFLQSWGQEHNEVLRALSSGPHETVSPLLWGSALGGGALLGDLVKSFVKRRFRIPPGQRWFPWDQLDLILGAVVLGRLVYPLPWAVMVTALVVTPLLGLIVNIGGYLLSVKEAW